MTASTLIGWTERSLGEATILDNLRVPLSAKQRARRAGPYPYCGANGVVDYIDAYMIDDDVILLAEDGGNFDQWRTRPIAYRMSGKIWVNNHAHVLTGDRDLDTGFLFYALEHKDITPFISSGTRSKLTRQDLVKIKVAVPEDHKEQQRIAGALDDAGAFIKTIERLIMKKEAVLQGMQQELLSGRTRLRGFTAVWESVRLGDHVAFLKAVPLSRAQLDEVSPVRYLHYGDIHTRRQVTIDAEIESMPRVPGELLRSAERLQVGDVVFADASEDLEGVGKSVEVTSVHADGVIAGLHTIAARFDQAVLADGFKAHLQFVPEFQTALRRLAAGTKVLATTRKHISSISLRLPPVDEQRAIAAAFQDAAAEIQLLEARLAKAQALKRGMMQELLTGRTRLQDEEAAA